MQLTAYTLAELVKSLRSQSRGSEKRKDPRVGLRLRTEIHPTDGGPPVGAWVRDVSAGGMSLLCDHEFKAGDLFNIPLGSNETDLALCVVRHSRRVASGLFGLGIQFVDFDPRAKRVKG